MPKWIYIVFYNASIILVALSFQYYSPYHYRFFNSDHAIVVLMSNQFEWPRDVYYWGQNRGGSLIPIFSYLLIQVLKIHPMMACSIVLYFFLSVTCLIVCSALKSLWLRAAVIILIFFPTNYIWVALLGHPYAGQLFCGALFCYFFLWLDNNLANSEITNLKTKIIQHLLLFLSVLFLFLGLWASEFSIIFFLVPILLIFSNPVYRNFKKTWDIYLHGFIGIILIALFIGHFKSLVPADERYNNMFISDFNEITTQFHYLITNIRTTLTFNDPFTVNNWYYYFLAVAFTLIILQKKSALPLKDKTLIRSLLVMTTVGFIGLFFSKWVYYSHVDSKYFTIVYYLVIFSMLILADNKFNTVLKATFFTGILLFSLSFTWLSLVCHNQPEPIISYRDFRQLPRGTLISHYWSAYLVNAVATDNLNSISYDDECVRNWNWRQEALNEKNFYFLDDTLNHSRTASDTIRQFEMNFCFTGKEYICNTTRVKLYHKSN